MEFEKIFDFLRCLVCQEELKKPFSLACGHLMCRNCLDGIKIEETVRCPACALCSNRSSAIRIYQLEDVIQLLQIKKKKRSERFCSQHRAELTLFCVNCKRDMCVECVQDHPTHKLKSAKSRKQEKALELLKKIDVIGTKELIEKMTKEKMLMLENVEIVKNALVAELSELKRKSKCLLKIENYKKMRQGDEIEIGSSLSDFNRFDLDKPEENLKLIVETIKKGLETIEKEKYKAKNFTGTCVYKFSKDCLKWKIGFSKESEIVRVNDYKFHIELTRMEEKRESFVKFFVYCEGVYEHEWRAKVHMKLQIEILDPKTRIGKRRVQDAKKLSEKMNHEFKWTNSEVGNADGVGIVDFVKWDMLSDLVNASKTGEVEFRCGIKVVA